VLNPPYGERLSATNIEQLYKRMGNTLKNKYPNCEAWILSANKDALKNIGLRSAKKCLLYNGALPCKYHKYELYTGTRRKKIVSL
jgi:putative N6-adenine-specific DNA methylase